MIKESITLKITLKEGFTILPGFEKEIKRNKNVDSVEVLELVKNDNRNP